MKCPNCHHDVEEGLGRCPHCGNEIEEIDHPQLNIITKLFIVVGLVVLFFCGIFYYTIHRNDPEYVRTQIDPDSTLADQFDVKFDTLPVDTSTANDKKADEEQAAKVFSSIRGKQTDVEETATDVDIEDAEPADETTPHVEASEPATSNELGAPKVENME